MRIGTSRADRLGFVVFAVLAGLLAVLVVTNLNNEPTESAQSVNTFAEAAPPTAVPTTAAISMPTPTATAVPVEVEPAAAPVTDEDEEPGDEGDADEDEDASTADGDDLADESAQSSQATQATAAPAVAVATSAPAPAATATSVPNPQPATTATAVPNPQPQATATSVPNPQPQETTTAVPNPQPASNPTGPVNVPADAPAGGTFTHTLSAKVARPTLHSSPGGPTFMPSFNGTALPAVNPTVFGNTLTYRVLAGEPGDDWAKVYVPARPNGTVAWVQTSQFNWGTSNRLLHINVSTNTVTVFEGSNVLLTTAAVTGASNSPTPLANGWVEEIMAGPSAAYGPRLISLGIFSNALNSFSGSVPKIALHGTNNPGIMGQYASNGCIRVPNDVITQIAGMLPVGSKVVITA